MPAPLTPFTDAPEPIAGWPDHPAMPEAPTAPVLASPVLVPQFAADKHSRGRNRGNR